MLGSCPSCLRYVIQRGSPVASPKNGKQWDQKRFQSTANKFGKKSGSTHQFTTFDKFQKRHDLSNPAKNCKKSKNYKKKTVTGGSVAGVDSNDRQVPLTNIFQLLQQIQMADVVATKWLQNEK